MTKEKCDKDSSCQICDEANTCSQAEKEAHERELLEKNMAGVKHSFMVLSGKGGVGKSTVAVNLALALAREGYEVGILDADIHGPNIPKMLGVEFERPRPAAVGMLPILTPHMIRVMSIGFLLRTPNDAVIWRGPLKHSLIQQFLGEVFWGGLDYLIIDLPPGTGDEALSTAHLLPDVDGAVVVTTPQEVALLDSRKCITFCRELKMPLIGVVENMSGLECPHCHKEIDLFKVGGGERAAREMNAIFLGRIPLDPQMVRDTDRGTPFVLEHPTSQATKSFQDIAKKWDEMIGEKATKRFKKTGSA
jgi:Mrp family chromosome partitioning ATPase